MCGACEGTLSLSARPITDVLVIDREEWDVGDRRAIEIMSARLQKVLQPLVVLVRPR